MSKPSLLLVDKDPKSRRVLEVSLRKAGYDVQLASGSVDAWEFLSQRPYDIVISDLSQDSSEALSLLTRSKEASPGDAAPFVFLTREGQVEEKKRALESGAAELIDRPIYAKEFLTRIKLLLQRQNRSRMESSSARTAFSGALSDLGVVDLLQALERGHKTGVITIESDGRKGELYVRNGRVIDAKLGRLTGEDAVYRMFLWTDGIYSGEFRNLRHDEKISLSSHGLILEGMRRLEEWTRLLDGLPPVHHICEVDYPALAERLGELPDEVNAVLRLFDGHRSLLQVIDDADFGPIETLTILGKLYAEGILYDTVQRPMRVKGSIPSLELERWLSGLPPALEAPPEPNGALPGPGEVAHSGGIVESSESPVASFEEPGLSVKSRQSLAIETPKEIPIPKIDPEPTPEEPPPAQPKVAEAKTTSVLDELKEATTKPSPKIEEPPKAPVVEAVKEQPVAAPRPSPSNPPPEEKRREPEPPPVVEVKKVVEERKAPPKEEPPVEKKAPLKAHPPEDDPRPKPRALAGHEDDHKEKDHEEDDHELLPPSGGSNKTVYYIAGAVALVLVLLFAFSGGEKEKPKPKLPIEPDPTSEAVVPDTVPATSLAASSLSLPVSTSTSAPASTPTSEPASGPAPLTPEQQARYTAATELGIKNYQDGKWEASITAYRDALAIDPNGRDALYGLGNALFEKGANDYDAGKKTSSMVPLQESAEHLELAVQKYPDFAGVHYALAVVYEYRSNRPELTKNKEEDRTKAKTEYETCLKLDPKGPYADAAKEGIKALSE